MSSFWLAATFTCLLIGFSTVQGQCLTDDDTPRPQKDLTRTGEILENGTNAFAFELLRQLQEDQSVGSQGLFFSPYSVWSALAVLYMGAHGLSEQELGSILGLYGSDKISVLAAFELLQASINEGTGNSNEVDKEASPDNVSQFVNRLFFHTDVKVKPCLEHIFAHNMAYVDFSVPESARQGINEWVKGQTRDKISELLPPNSVGLDTLMVIANAVYFRKDWLHRFNPKLTRPDRFTVSLTEELVVDMMRTKGNFLYGVSEALQCTALDIPYVGGAEDSGGDLSMTILLHENRVFDMNSFVLRLTSERVDELIENLYPIEVQVALPKFKMADDFELTSKLTRMGLKTIFYPLQSDLSGFTGEPELFVNSVVHQATIEVNEQGTEAAAATAILSSRTARPAQPTAFIVNRPFVFLIRNSKTNLVYFIGTVLRPTRSASAQAAKSPPYHSRQV